MVWSDIGDIRLQLRNRSINAANADEATTQGTCYLQGCLATVLGRGYLSELR